MWAWPKIHGSAVIEIVYKIHTAFEPTFAICENHVMKVTDVKGANNGYYLMIKYMIDSLLIKCHKLMQCLWGDL